MSTDTTRRDLLTGTAAIGGAELLPFVRPVKAKTPEPTCDADEPITFDDLANAEFEAEIFESDNPVEAVRQLYFQTWPVVAVMTMALQKGHHGLARFANVCPDESFKAIIHDMQQAQSYFRNLAELMDKAEIRIMAGAHRLAKERGA